MAGTVIGGQRAKETNVSKYGEDYYRNIGAKGGSAKVPKGFAVNRSLARTAGQKVAQYRGGVKMQIDAKHIPTAYEIETSVSPKCNHLSSEVLEVDDYAWGSGSDGEMEMYDTISYVLVCRNCGKILEDRYNGEFDEYTDVE